MFTLPRRFASPVVGVTAVLLLAGCASASPAPSPTPTPAATRTVLPAAAPGSRIPLSCSALYTSDTVASLVGAPVTVLRDANTAPTSLSDVANAQLGVLGCDWGGMDAVEFGNLADLTIFIAPDSQAAFEKDYAGAIADRPESASPPVGTTAGDKSGYWCEAGGRAEDAPLCDGQLLVGNYWVSVQLEAVAPTTEVSTNANMKKVLSRVAHALHAAGEPRTSAWVSPAATVPDFCTDKDTTTQVRTILGMPGISPAPPTVPSVDAASVALNERGAACTWHDPTAGTADFQLLSGGSWVFPGFAPVPPADDVVRSYSPVTVPGTGAALLGTGEGGAEAVIAVGPTLVLIDMPDLGPAQNITALAAFAKLISAG